MGRVAVVGVGYWGKNLVRNFHALGALAATCDTDPTVLANTKDSYNDVPVFQNFDSLLDGLALKIEAIVIATPAETHYSLTKKALLAGKHVLVEKPLSLNYGEGKELVELARKNQLILMVGHVLHYHPAVIKLKELVDSGELGKIQYLYSNRLNIGKIRREENILWSFAPHDISAILMLLGESPETVYATGATHLQHKIPDTTLTTMQFSSGVMAHIFVSWLHPFKEQKLVVVGDKKMAVFDDVSQEKLLLYPHQINWINRIPVAAKAKAEVVPVDMVEPLKAECQHFLDCIAERKAPMTDGQEGLRVLEVLQALQESINKNGCKIRLPLSIHGTLVKTLQIQKDLIEETKLRLDDKTNLADNSFFIHESSYIDERVEIGKDTKIWHFSHILRDSRIGQNCSIGQNVVIGPEVSIGNGCKIQNNVSVYQGVTLEDEVFCGPSMVFTNVYNPRSAIRRMDELRPTLVKKGASIGANATIVCGINIGKYAFIGAGAVVIRDVPDYALMVGNPATQKGWMCVCGIRLHISESEWQCNACKRKFRMINPDQIDELGN